MKTGRIIVLIGKALGLVALVVFLSFLSGKVIGEKAERESGETQIVIREEMTVAEFGAENHLDRQVLKKIFGLTGEQDLQKRISGLALTSDQIVAAVGKELSLGEEYESRNWVLIPIKFALWVVFLSIVFVMMRKSAVQTPLRIFLYLFAILVFGIILGSDPSPMGTVKDAIVLLGTKGVLFPPRMVAMSLFVAITLVANKFICSWGCQFGTLQDLLFRLGNTRGGAGKKRLDPRIKIPFAVTNGIRIAGFGLLSFAAFAWGFDLIRPVDPFKIYRPAVIGITGTAFLAALLAASLLVYRPWCHLFCPFGLVAWLVEKISIFRINVNYDTCVACESCAKSCPSTVMDAILKRTRTIPDCFSCGTCIEVCPTKSIRFVSGKRAVPPEGKFGGKKK